MIRKTALCLLVVCLLSIAPGRAQDDRADPRDGEVVTFTDSKGIKNHVRRFGKVFNAGLLIASHGDSELQIPWARVKSFRNGPISDSRMTVELTFVNGKRMEVLVSRSEYETFYSGDAEFGRLRIRYQDIRELSFDSRNETGSRCAKGHIYYEDTWKFCPYDGLELKPIRD